MLRDSDLVSIQEVRIKVEKAYAAWQKYRNYSQEQVDAIVERMGAAGRANARRLAELAVEETGYGNAKDKLAKNLLCADLLIRHGGHAQAASATVRNLGRASQVEGVVSWVVASFLRYPLSTRKRKKDRSAEMSRARDRAERPAWLSPWMKRTSVSSETRGRGIFRVLRTSTSLRMSLS